MGLYRKFVRVILFLFLLFSIPVASAAMLPGTLWLKPVNTVEVGCYDLLELIVECPIAAKNPFNLEELDIAVHFTRSSEHQLAVRTFWYKDISDGTYQVHWFDPQTGTWLPEAATTAQNGTLTIPIPTFERDLAAKIHQ